MNRTDILERLAPARQALERMGVASLSLFGSAARGEATDRSDADFLVAFRDPPTFDRYMDVKLLLEEKLGVRVDLVTDSGVRPELRSTIQRDAIRVA